MVDFKIVLSDPQSGRSYKIDATGAAAGAFVGKRIGEAIDGNVLGLNGYAVEITGGTDKTGIPARRDLPGSGRRRLLLSEGTGFHPVYDGERRRKSVRGSEISPDFVQINAIVKTYGEKPLAEYFEQPQEAAE
ncbi:30S ribosomal protein S6e [Methanoculleus sp. FWC-SCC1]|uniref:Small ribosomal subunit protein eS6 n=1 Tax=Methanoculleus frigidifontis TaxID=2584085 RepID=A0ABT8ME53_9EURY|nr:30S ribosomal protein S6e [Methanoculleus sp. FWC-SCC1]MDN7026161.1 30S ribosomal protein S6e [Methanoculleus sp. FWC-SCC1]